MASPTLLVRTGPLECDCDCDSISMSVYKKPPSVSRAHVLHEHVCMHMFVNVSAYGARQCPCLLVCLRSQEHAHVRTQAREIHTNTSIHIKAHTNIHILHNGVQQILVCGFMIRSKPKHKMLAPARMSVYH